MNKRTEEVLESIIVHFINTAEPIGSRVLSKIMKVKISAATIRNVMSDLTDLDMITQPHTSAGRIPTDKAYRYYINKLLKSKKTTGKEYRLNRVYESCGQPSRLEDILLDVTNELSRITNCTGIIMSPTLSASRLKKIQMLKLSSSQLLVLIVTQVGMVHSKIIHLRQCPDQKTLNTMSMVLIGLFEYKTIASIRKSLVKTLSQKKGEYDQLLARAIRLGKKAFDTDKPGDLYILGRSKMCAFPEFSDQEQLENVYKVFEEKTPLTDILISVMENDGIQIKIGNENKNTGLSHCSVIAGTYGNKNYLLGSIGIVGPTRINYSKVISAIDYSARKLSFSLGQFIGNG